MSQGYLEIIIGNMFSGKSTELVRRINREKSINKQILTINYTHDNRYSTDSVSTHDHTSVKCIKLEKLSDLKADYLDEYDSFFIDEGQFFSDLYTIVYSLVDIHKKHVVVAGLDGDFNRNQFGQMLKLIPIADKVDKFSAYCSICNNGTLAPFTKRISKFHNNQIDVGSKDKYIAVCRTHYSN